MNSLPHSNGVRQSPHTQKSTPIYVNHRGRNICVGQVSGQTFIKHTKHILHSPAGICLDAQNIVDAEKAGAIRIEIHYNGSVYRTTFETFKSKCFKVTRGDGYQLGLASSYWSINGQQPAAERQAEAEAIKQEAASMKQLDLFGDVR